MTTKLKGKIAAIKKSTNGICIDEKWYTVIGKATAYILPKLINADVEISLTDDSQVTFITVEKEGEQNQTPYTPQASPTTGPDWDAKDRRIVRQNSLTQANSFLKTVIESDEVVEKLTMDGKKALLFTLAEECEKWVYRNG